MSLFCKIDDLKNESDVEQKLIWPMLSSPAPDGLGYSPSDIYTKHNIRNFEIDKGNSKKVYRPDYILILGGLPVAVIEAKRPDEDIDEALREARLYANELNAIHRPGVNPCVRVVATNGLRLISCPADSAVHDFQIDFADINLGSQRYHELLQLLARQRLQDHADALRRTLRKDEYRRATHLLGGKSARNDEVGYNQFGARISIDFLHVFNPQTRQDRAEVVRHAYVPSRRREHYTDEIDRVIRVAVPSPAGSGTLIEDSSHPAELLRLMGRGKDLQNKLFLLVGAVGSGKSTFVDYLREMKLDQKVKAGTMWITIDLNGSPVGQEMLQAWIVDEIIRELTASHPGEALGEHDTLLKVFGIEMRDLKHGPLKNLPASSLRYQEAIADKLIELTVNRVTHAKALARYLCSERGKLLVLVLDNCDKGDLEEQLDVFQIVRWIQSWFKCLVFLPIRDVTYHAYKNRPPLDTVIKDFVFRIESPPFGNVLRERIKMALAQAVMVYGGQPLSYTLESGIRVVYPPTEVGYYLACIYRSLFEHDKLLRRMLIGLAGKNIRKAMEIFLDFCKSGHIGGKEFLKIRAARGDYALPYKIVTRVLLRQNRRFYDGDESHLKNVFQCVPSDPRPDHFVRLAILLWLAQRFQEKGPTGVRAFHRADRLITELLPFGHDALRIRQELLYLVKATCVLTEHQRPDSVSDEDLICLSPAGFAHLEMIKNFDYLAACAEDSWVSDHEFAQRVAVRIGQYGVHFHYARETTRANAGEFIRHLVADAGEEVAVPEGYLEDVGVGTLAEVTEIEKDIAVRIEKEEAKDRWHRVEDQFAIESIHQGVVDGVKDFGVFVNLPDGPRGLLHISKLGPGRSISSIKKGQEIKVRVLAINREERRISLGAVQ
jgi:hypothetical protein